MHLLCALHNIAQSKTKNGAIINRKKTKNNNKINSKQTTKNLQNNSVHNA
jgi:hypothetical protein